MYKNEENRHYLKTNLSDNVRRDYFMIYILLLYQLYSLIHFSEKIEYELSADAKDYLRAPEAYNLKLKEIQAEINTFLLKSVHTSVSQMQTQNDFYQFAKNLLKTDTVRMGDLLLIGDFDALFYEARRLTHRLREGLPV